ncbi:MAG: replication-associated recombination protein A [Candidatus Tectomicrobia bacterium]|nr:replication-associated recombination protein A [Candidatus Tectomicrobia bacterium]
MELFEPPEPSESRRAGEEDRADGESLRPLADRVRPETLDEFVGQRHILGEGQVLRRIIEADEPTSILFWGPPGSGKTTLARIIARRTGANFVSFSAVLSGVKELREVVEAARRVRRAQGRRTVLFVDEIHRFNKAQQDAFLPHVESGLITLIGATTENPSFEVNSALLSRCRVFVLEALTAGEVRALLDRALRSQKGLAPLRVEADEEALEHLARMSNGDARVALSALEMAALAAEPDPEGRRRVSLLDAEGALQRRALLYDRAGEEHYNVISALHKSLRGSDPDAALYWLARMIEAGEDPLYIARRMVRFASEDVGMADPQALAVALAAKDAFHFIGPPEGYLALAQAAVYLATAPKSNALYAAYGEAVRDVRETMNEPVPLHIRNAPTRLMSELGYGKGYQYAHDREGAFAPEQAYLPDNLAGRTYYRPTDRGFEKTVGERLARWRELVHKAREKKGKGKDRA